MHVHLCIVPSNRSACLCDCISKVFARNSKVNIITQTTKATTTAATTVVDLSAAATMTDRLAADTKSRLSQSCAGSC